MSEQVLLYIDHRKRPVTTTPRFTFPHFPSLAFVPFPSASSQIETQRLWRICFATIFSLIFHIAVWGSYLLFAIVEKGDSFISGLFFGKVLGFFEILPFFLFLPLSASLLFCFSAFLPFRFSRCSCFSAFPAVPASLLFCALPAFLAVPASFLLFLLLCFSVFLLLCFFVCLLVLLFQIVSIKKAQTNNKEQHGMCSRPPNRFFKMVDPPLLVHSARTRQQWHWQAQWQLRRKHSQTTAGKKAAGIATNDALLTNTV